MIDFKAMTTPMASNMKLLSDASSKSVDATLYRQMIGSLMYLTNTRLDMLCCEHFQPVLDVSKTSSPGCCKAYIEVLKGTVDYGLMYDRNQKVNL